MTSRRAALVARVLGERRHFVDVWEVTALIESLGYNDARLRSECGYDDALAAGRDVYASAQRRTHRDDPWKASLESWGAVLMRAAVSSQIYSVPWLIVFTAQISHPDALTLPTQVAPSLTLALMFSLIASGGFVQVIVRRGEFYVGIKQPGLARAAVLEVLGLGVATSVIAALVGVFIARYFELASWPALILGVDAFLGLSLLWMVCATFTIYQAHWRVAAAFLAGLGAFAVSRLAGAEALTSQLVAGLVVLLCIIEQARRLFPRETGAVRMPTAVARPRSAVMAYWMLPYFWYGLLYFSFLFADRLTAGVAQATLSRSSFGMPPSYVQGMEPALLTLLIAASGIEVASSLFARAMAVQAEGAFRGDATRLSGVLRAEYGRAIAITLVTFAVSACGVALVAFRFLLDTGPARATLVAGDVAYACVAVGLVNVVVLFQLHQPWLPVRRLVQALPLNLASGYVLSLTFGSAFAVAGLFIGGAYFAIASTADVLRALRRPDVAYAVNY